MQPAETFEPTAPIGRPTLRDVQWTWGDVLIGFAPIIVARVAPALMNPAMFSRAPHWLWVPFTLLAMIWMFAYPLLIAARRIGLPLVPRPRVILIELLIALIAVPVGMVIMTGVSMVLMRLFGAASMATSPLEPIAGSSNRFEPLALVILAIVVAPFAEEIFFRGMLYNALRQRMNPILAAMIQAVIFGLSHPFGLADQAVIIVLAIFIGLLYEWRKILLTPILFHALTNAVAIVLMFWSMAFYANAPVLGIRAVSHESGCLVTEVASGGAADESGLRAGDVIEAVDDVGVKDQRGIVGVMRTKQVGDRVPIDYLRVGQAYRVDATLKARPK
jgi:membrane protease YdiL (CAAX protease family)